MKKVVALVLLVVATALAVAYWVPITVGGKGGAPEPGSPAFKQPLGTAAIPPAPPQFGGVIRDVESESKTWWPPMIVPPKGAPNVLLILTDDVGFGAPSTFGGVIPTATASCSPRRTPGTATS